jgi:hypothetical protein
LPADSDEVFEQPPSPPGHPPAPSPEGSYAAVDRDVIYTVCSTLVLSPTNAQYTYQDVVFHHW